MAIINCPECHKEISDKAKICPYCGNPLKTIRYKFWFTIFSIIAIIAIGIVAIVKYSNERKQIKEAIVNHDNYLRQTVANQSYPVKPKSYTDLEYINKHYKPTTPYCRLAIYDALHIDKANNVPFEDTKVYLEWEDCIKYNLEPIF